MAEVILSPLLDLIFGNLASAAMQELKLVWGAGVDKELQDLKSTFSAIQAVLMDAEERQFQSKAVQDWLRKLKDVAFDADDLVDEIVTEAQQSKTEIGKKRKRVWDYFSSFFNSSQRDMARRVREINMRLAKIAKERKDLHIETKDESKQLEITRERRRLPISSVRDESSEVLGRGDDREKIVKSLLSDDSGDRRFSVIAIVGIGGVGKTTLAQVVYNDKRITENFELRAWVCVSEDFNFERLTKEIIASASKSTCDLSDIDTLQCSLRDMLSGRKFLLVLDDVWNENDSYSWELLQAPLTFGAKGSKILVTTRSQAVSDVMQAKVTHNLMGLSKQDCWSLFVGQAFKGETIHAYPDLLKIGEEVVDKCGGLPLAAKALGGLLSSKREVREWENIPKSPIWDLPGPASKMLPALRLSYQHLPAHLKCCSIFPKNYEFRTEKLIQLWIAHGFVCPKEGKQIEDIGSEYFNDLLLRSFFQISSFVKTAEHIKYKMHDLFHDLAQFISGSECFQMEHTKSGGVLREARHLSYVVGDGELINFEPFYESKGLRTLLLMQNFEDINKKVPHEIFERLRFLRVLDLSWTKIKELPNSVGNLKHLRYLNLENTKIEELPESICSIYNMQTLVLSYCCRLVKLPNEMKKLTNLRHLHIESCNLVCMPPQIGRLTCLQSLPLFVVSRESERGITELKELTNIRGKVRIQKLENVVEAMEAQQANLKNKLFIDHLSLAWSKDHDHSLQNGRFEEEVAEGLQPPPELKTLEFTGYMGAHFPSWMMKIDMFLPDLTTFYLGYCRCSTLPPLGRLSSLSHLEIYQINGVNQIGGDFCGMAGGFPSLKQLNLNGMRRLKYWHETEEGDFPCLQTLHIKNCHQLRQIPQGPFSRLTHLNIEGCERFISLPRLPSLKILRLHYLDNLVEWHDVGEVDFPYLERLSIRGCPKMTRWPSILPVITELAVSNCKGFDALPPLCSLCNLWLGPHSDKLLKSVPCLTSLSSLTIFNNPNLTSMPQGMLQALTQLKDLEIHDCKMLVTLKEEEGSQEESLPSTLTNLWFIKCFSLKSLPRGLHALNCLQTLKIEDCPHVTCFPEEGLPILLQRLQIIRCPAIKERCLKDVGKDWPKISHIPHVLLI